VEQEAIALRYRSTILYLAAALLLVGLYLYDIHQDKKKEQVEETAKVLLGIKADQINGITLKKGNEAIELQKTEGTGKDTWNITAPIKTTADGLAVEGLKKRLAGLKYTRVIAEKSDDPGLFGLDKPSFNITYNAGKVSGQLAFGSLTPLGDGYYVRKNTEKKIYLVDKFEKDELRVSLFELRDKRLFTLSPVKVNRFIIDRGKDRWSLIRKKGRWRLEDDADLKVDTRKIDTLVSKFARAGAVSFEKEAVTDLKPFGLDPPAVVVTLSEGKNSQAILLGGHSKENKTRIYAKIQGRPELVTVNKWLLNDLPRTREEIKEEKAAEEKKDAKTHR